jgi:hypothetical protein
MPPIHRARAVVVLFASGALAACAPSPPPASNARAAAPPLLRESAPPATPVAPDPFVATVRPILLSHCVPCHEPGGKMYARMPFDDPKTIREHREGVLRRLKVPEERAAVESWLGTP